MFTGTFARLLFHEPDGRVDINPFRQRNSEKFVFSISVRSDETTSHSAFASFPRAGFRHDMGLLTVEGVHHAFAGVRSEQYQCPILCHPKIIFS